jgi:hypothetical protein
MIKKLEGKIWVMAESDARFDGYSDLLAMPKTQRKRYLDRAERSYYALQQLTYDQMQYEFESLKDNKENIE